MLYIGKDIRTAKGYQEFNNIIAASKCFETVIILTNNIEDNKEHVDSITGVDNIFFEYYTSFRIISNKIFSFNLYHQIKKHNPRIIFIHDFYFSIIPIYIYKIFYKCEKVLFVSHSDFTNTARNLFVRNLFYKIFIKYFIIKPFQRAVDNFMGINPSSIIFLKYIGVQSEDVRLFPLAFELNLLKRTDQFFRDKMLKLLQPNDIVIVTGGHLASYKKTESLILGFIESRRIDLKLFIFGDSKDLTYGEYLKKVATGHPNIIFLGFLNTLQVDTLLSIADVAIFPASQSVLWQRCLSHGLMLVVGRYITFDDVHFLEQDVDYLNEFGSIYVLEDKYNREIAIKSLLKKIDIEFMQRFKDSARKYSDTYLDLVKNFQAIKSF